MKAMIFFLLLCLTFSLAGDVHNAIGEELEAQIRKMDIYYGTGKYDELIKAAEKVLEIDPFNFVVLSYKAMAHLGKGEWDKAISSAKILTELQPDNSLTHTALGQAYGGNMQFNNAIEAFDKALELNPQDVGALLYLGAAYVELGQKNEAMVVYEKLKIIDYRASQELLNAIRTSKVLR
jgi:tetratricopeptide (TPR) repeat protein